MYTKDNVWTKNHMRLLFVVGTFITLTLTSCQTIEQMAPPVGPEFSTTGTNVVSLAALKRGREVYLSDCTRCHSVEPINRYSKDRWRTILERMGPQSKLDESRTDALEAYVFAAHTVMAMEAAQE